MTEGAQAPRRRSARYACNSSIETRSCAMVSRSRTVTARSSSESKSTVTQNGVPSRPGDGSGGRSPRVVEVDGPGAAERVGDLASERREVLVARQRQHGGLDRSQARVELEHGAHVGAALGVGHLLLAVRVDEERHHRARETERRLDHVRGVALAGGLVEVRQALAGRFAVAGEVVVGAVGDAHELAPLLAREAELVLDVDRAGRVVRAVVFRHVELAACSRGRCPGR